VHLKGRDLYERKDDGTYNRDNFHEHPEEYKCSFSPFVKQTDILLNGVYWDKTIPSLFTLDEFRSPSFKIQTIADVTNDTSGSIPINIGDSTIQDPVYGVDKITLQRTAPYLPASVDVMAVANLPNELPRDASRYFGEQLIKFVLDDLAKGGSAILERATMLKRGVLTEEYCYLKEYAAVK
jgi:alanine dehydrogenase